MKQPAMLLFVTLAVAISGSAYAVADNLEAGNSAFQRGNFADAVQEYERQVSLGVVHEDLYYNLGNAYFRMGELGKAIYNYERALRLDTELEDARYNMRVARDVVAERHHDRLKGAEVDPMWVRLVTHFGVGELTVGLLVLNLLVFACLITLRFLAVGVVRTVVTVISVFSFAALLGCAALFAGHVYFVERVHWGVVVSDEVVLREGTDQGFAERGQLHAGLRVRVMETKAGWYRVRLSNGVEGWVQKPHVGSL